MFEFRKFTSRDARAFADFLNHVRQNHWTLTSQAGQREPDRVALVAAEQLVEEDCNSNRAGSFLLKRDGRIVSCLQVDDKFGDGQVAVFSHAETLPEYQRRGIFGRLLGEVCLRKICSMGFERIEASTWSFNRKGIPLYKRAGFRGVPGTSLHMENYLPLVLRHPSTQSYFSRCDYVRTLQNKRSFGYDAVDAYGLSVFEYRWRSKEDRLRVLIDWQRRQIASIQRPDWGAWCYVDREMPFQIHYQVEARGDTGLPIGIRIPGMGGQSFLQQRLLPGRTSAGKIRIADSPGGMIPGIAVELQIGGTNVPFPLHRFREITEKSGRDATLRE